MPAKNNHKLVLLCALFAAICGVLAAGYATYLDWQINPSGLYHDGETTHWNIVLDTALSWFLPVTPVVFLLAMIVGYLVIKLTQ